MVSILSLWLPVLISAIVVFVISSILHMFLPYHKNDYVGLPNEDQVIQALRGFHIPPGEYAVPAPVSTQEMKNPEYTEKLEKGPVALMTVLKNGNQSMGSALVIWFLYCLLVGMLAAYISGRALGPGASYLSVFRFAGATAFIAYSIALIQDSIWFGRKWSTTLKNVIDGLIYALLTAGVFGWLWPAM